MSRWRPHTTGILFTGLGLILVALVGSYIFTNFQPTTEVRLSSIVLDVKVATNDESRQKGLSGVKALDANGGLLMVFPEDKKWGIWMKDMNIPIDILWLDKDKKVIYIVTGAAPELSTSKTFIPNTPARYVLEVQAGTVKNAAVKVGDVVAFNVNEDAVR